MNEYLSHLLFPFVFLITFVILRVLYIILTFLPEKRCNINIVNEYFGREAYFADKGLSALLYILWRALSIRSPSLGFKEKGYFPGALTFTGKVMANDEKIYIHDFSSKVNINWVYKIVFSLISTVLLAVMSVFAYLKIPVISSCYSICFSIAAAKFACGIFAGIYTTYMYYIKKVYIIIKLLKTKNNDVMNEIIGSSNIQAYLKLFGNLKKQTSFIKKLNGQSVNQIYPNIYPNKPMDPIFSVISYTSLLASNHVNIIIKKNPILHFINNIYLTSGTRYLFIMVLICIVINSSYSMAYTLTTSSTNTSKSPIKNDSKYVGISLAFLIVLLICGWVLYDFLISCSEYVYRHMYNISNNTLMDYILEIYRICFFNCTSHMDVVFQQSGIQGFKERFIQFTIKCCCPIWIAILIAFFLTLSIQLCQINADANDSPSVADQLYSQQNIKSQYDLGFMSTLKSTTIVSVILLSVLYYLEHIGYFKQNISDRLVFIMACLVIIVICIPVVMYIVNAINDRMKFI